MSDVKFCKVIKLLSFDLYGKPLQTAVQYLSMAVIVFFSLCVFDCLGVCVHVELYYIDRCFDSPCLKVAEH